MTGDDLTAAGVPPQAPADHGRRREPWRAFARALGAQLEEIRADPVLRLYGAVLALLNILTVPYWRWSGEQTVMSRGSEPICWPLVPNCADLRVLTPDQVYRLLQLFALGALVVAALFLWRRSVPAAWAGLLALNLVKLALLALDYRLRHNQHYMALWVAAVFLFVPGKRDALRVLIVLFYFWAGTLKLNWEWISGAALYRPLWFFTGAGVIVACAYVVVMELVVAWGLLAARAWIFWAALAQVALFHVMSWAIVDFFYPLLMFLLLDGAGLNRCEKIVRLSAWPAGVEALRVCWEGERRDRNCGECEKCVRTMCNFLAAGLPVPPCFDRTPTVALIERIRLRSPVLAEEWAQLLVVAQQNGVGATWVDIARRKVTGYRRRTAVREAAGRLARATLPGGIRRLVRRTVFA